eukprot:TRINITY_DN5960_c0_g2_i1.p1 TRINITY_DN5960_c0_g2~~TRINITY_DN5960_c0_g2_i1.p1  ORF type:complete len:1043 (-),score=334.12 TRINITY_DN5960_c0_g2_i1:40-2859(-)
MMLEGTAPPKQTAVVEQPKPPRKMASVKAKRSTTNLMTLLSEAPPPAPSTPSLSSSSDCIPIEEGPTGKENQTNNTLPLKIQKPSTPPMEPEPKPIIPIAPASQLFSPKWRRSSSLSGFALKSKTLELKLDLSSSEDEAEEEKPDLKRSKSIPTSSRSNPSDAEDHTAMQLEDSFKGKRTNFVKQKLKGDFKGKKAFKKDGRFVKASSKSDPHAVGYDGESIPIESSLDPMQDADEPTFSWDDIDESDLIAAMEESEASEKKKEIFKLKKSDEELKKCLKSNFGFSKFREGQLDTIQRVLSGKSTLLILPTGAGKSLCYQLPAVLMPEPSLVIVISPLLSLMKDQLNNLPSCITGACLTSHQSPTEVKQTIEDLKKGSIKVLFVAPEKLVTPNFIKLVASLPPIAFACIDEAHCVSEWSHNFRTSYLMLRSVLKNQMNVNCVLALTATATKRTENSISEIMGIPREGVIRISAIRSNLKLSVSKDVDKYKGLVSLLKSSRFSQSQSTIIYCSFQKKADEIANYLQINLFDAMSYHAGKTQKQRKDVQDLFMKNKLKIVVATVAFGMGIDKSDVRAVIHFDLPRSLENYIQEIGRAGRDGKDSECHLFLHADDFSLLRSFAYSDSVDQFPVKQVLHHIFPNKHGDRQGDRHGKHRQHVGTEFTAVDVEGVERDYDVKKEVIQTVLSYLELQGFIRIRDNIATIANLNFHKTDPKKLANTNNVVAWILAHAKKSHASYVVDLLEASKALDMDIPLIQKELYRLQNDLHEISYELIGKSQYIEIRSRPDMDDVLADMMKRLDDLERVKLMQINSIWKVMNAVAYLDSSYIDMEDETKMDEMHRLIHEYFTGDLDDAEMEWISLGNQKAVNEGVLRGDILSLIRNCPALDTGRKIARIFHGVSSPTFPATEWCRNSFWNRHRDVSFHLLIKMATQMIVDVKNS